MNRHLEIEVRSVYGETKCYPANDIAYTFADIAGTKTLTRHTLAGAIALGYSITVLPMEGDTIKGFIDALAADLHRENSRVAS